MGRDVSVWQISLDLPLDAEQRASLSEDEHRRASRFRDPRHAHRWCVAHVALRDILATAMQCDPRVLRFSATDAGKPLLASPAGTPAFNLSHADDMALVAVGGDEPIGVDIESLKPVPELDDIARSHFAPEEQAALSQAPADRRLVTFYQIWTRKEAFVKATGVGVGGALRRFAVTVGSDDVRFLRIDPDVSTGRAWRLVDLGLAMPYVGALVVPAGVNGPLSVRRWSAPGRRD